ncbi:very short patch repair endonuclease [Pseudodesulfovibrio thermohalotolerans]|uniref:very short patch repair endonuclease n=1 Tax=Pseudodesulfovibrio thermohalotolerans TaxID=2880651 RepID=UPI002441AA43|nr:very short patch repair endonuclease [Pseudodesulfovibrio thermohalotolerans]WFS61877.1 very short patch repair endonuclease [Pseudodesulfovibrio thermohalotolerans]
MLMDTVSTAKRSAMMRSIKGKNTKPEMVVRRLLHADGYRFRVNYRGVIGTPDLVFTKRKKVIFIHGCFWHRHPGCPRASMPKTNVPFWENKFRHNIEHDQAVLQGLHDDGWAVLIVWECETKQPEALLVKLRDFLGPTKIQ